jgi:hypothetical protein
MHVYPGVPWDAWPDMPYELLLDCIDVVKKMFGNRE